jgi:hypothetical protein
VAELRNGTWEMGFRYRRWAGLVLAEFNVGPYVEPLLRRKRPTLYFALFGLSHLSKKRVKSSLYSRSCSASQSKLLVEVQ